MYYCIYLIKVDIFNIESNADLHVKLAGVKYLYYVGQSFIITMKLTELLVKFYLVYKP